MNGWPHPLHMIKENMEKQLEWCAKAPFYTLGRSPPIARLRSHHQRLAPR
jgi:thiamine biosynthesis protein ThiC